MTRFRNRFLVFSLVLSLACAGFQSTARAVDDNEGQPLYFKTSADNILKAYWRMKNIDTESSENIDQFLMVTECSLYTQFYQDEFEWSKIRSATRNYIKSNMNTFPRRFEIIQPIMLDRYDEVRKGYPIMEKDQIIGVTKIEASENRREESPCLGGAQYKQKEFPINAILNMSRPLDYTFVPTSSESLAEYTDYIKENKINISYGRPAYIRYRFKVEQSLGITMLDPLAYANFYGALESYAVFGDRGFFIKLDEKLF